MHLDDDTGTRSFSLRGSARQDRFSCEGKALRSTVNIELKANTLGVAENAALQQQLSASRVSVLCRKGSNKL